MALLELRTLVGGLRNRPGNWKRDLLRLALPLITRSTGGLDSHPCATCWQASELHSELDSWFSTSLGAVCAVLCLCATWSPIPFVQVFPLLCRCELRAPARICAVGSFFVCPGR